MNPVLGMLEVTGLIRQEGGETGTEYAFRHTLLRDTAYSSLLREERKSLHRAVGRALERMHPTREPELASVLAHHFLRADLKTEAFHYLRLAAEGAARVYALAEALDHYEGALELALAGFGNEEGDLDYLFERKGRMFELAGRYQEAVQTYREMEAEGQRRSDPAMEARALLRQASMYSIPSAIMDRERGRDLSEKALAVARELADHEIKSVAHWNLMKVEEFGLNYKAARVHGERALALLEGLDASEQKAFILNDLAAIYMSTSDFKRGLEVSLEAKKLWRQLDNLPMLVDASCNEMTLHLLQGRYDAAKELSQQSVELSETIDNAWGKSYSRYMIYWAYAEEGDFARAFNTGRECVALAEEAGFLVPRFQTLADLGLMHAYLGEFEKAHALLDEASENAKKHMDTWAVYPSALKALVLTWQERYDQAEESLQPLLGSTVPIDNDEFSFVGFLLSLVYPGYWLGRENWDRALAEADRFIDIFDHAEIKFLGSDLHLYRGLALRALGRAEEAHSALEEGVSRAQALGSQRSLWRLFDALAALALEIGDETAAGEYKRAAKEGVLLIADHTQSEAQRQSFLREVVRSSMALDEL